MSDPARRWRDVVPALLVAVPALLCVGRATERASWASLGRDQGIFQYVAWAVGQGEVAYRDVRDVNGPVITMVHLAFQRLGGTDEHRFRVLDLLVTGLTFAFAGACISSLTRARSLGARASWALAAWACLTAQYIAYGFWDTAQRESFLDWFVLVSIALGMTRSAGAEPKGRGPTAALFVSGALSFVPWLGKPTFALFTASQLVALLVEDEPRRARGRRLVTFLLGGAAGLVVPLSFLALRGDVGAWARITFVDVPAMYRFIWPRPASAILLLPGYARLALLALATSLGLALLVARGRLPRRAIPVAAMPALGLASVVVQAKGFPYHFHPVTLGISFGWLIGVAIAWESALLVPGVARRAAALGAAIFVGVRAALLASNAPDPEAPAADARDKAALESGERLAAFERIDFFPRALRDAAEFVARSTRPEDRVQTYGMDAYVLFLAQRRSATPYVYAYDLNVDDALHGSFDPGGARPTAEQADRIRAMQAAHAADLLAKLEKSPPAAFVFVDRSPLMSDVDAARDFAAHCPEAAGWLASRYSEAADFDGVRVWLPRTSE